MEKIIMDVWGGEGSMDHIARFICDMDQAFERSRKELRNGYLVNLRADHAWGDYSEFDERTHSAPVLKVVQ